MKRKYQKRLEELSSKTTSNSEVDTPIALDVIEDLEEILTLPQPLREISLVQSICDQHRRKKKEKLKIQTLINLNSTSRINSSREDLLPAELALWQESRIEDINSRN